MSKYCTKCGFQNDNDDLFCVSCGNPLKPAPQPQTAPQSAIITEYQSAQTDAAAAANKPNILEVAVYKRKVGVCILLSFITLGIYAIYWQYLLVKNVRAIKGDDSSCTGEMLCLLFVPFYSLYWWFTRGDYVKKYLSDNGKYSSSSGALYLVLSIFGLSIVAAAIMQNDFNSLDYAERKCAAAKPFAIAAGVLFLLSSWIFIITFILSLERSDTITGVIAVLSVLSFVFASIGLFKRDKRIVIIAFLALAFVSLIGIVFNFAAYDKNPSFIQAAAIQAAAEGVAFLIPACFFAGILYHSTKKPVGKVCILPWIIQLVLFIFHAIATAVINYYEQVLEYNNYYDNYWEYGYYHHAPSFADSLFSHIFISLLIFALPIIGYIFAGKWLEYEAKEASETISTSAEHDE